MKTPALYLISLFFLFSGCGDDLDIEKGTPKCIKKRIKDFNEEIACNSANVKEYRFQEKTVYVFSHGTCGRDMGESVVDSDCNNLGYLGSISGNTEINGEDFSSAQYVKTTWQK